MPTSSDSPSAGRKGGLFLRILLPFSLLLAAAIAGFLVIALIAIDRSLQADAAGRAGRVAELLARSPYLANEPVLAQMAGLAGMDFLVLDRDNSIRAGTVTDPDLRRAGRQLTSPTPVFLADAPTSMALARPLAPPSDAGGRLVVIVDPTPQRLLWQRMRNSFLWLGATLLPVVAVIAFFLARSLSLPLERLVDCVSAIARGDRRARAAIGGGGEVARLAGAFNAMVADLEAYETRLIDTERLAAAGRMAAALSHEIKNPLTSIKMFIQVLKGRLQEHPDHRRVLDLVQKEIDRLTGIVDQLAGRTGPAELRPVAADLAAVVGEVLGLAGELLARQNIRLIREIVTPPPIIPLDPEKIKQVCWNLLLNARDAMPAGGQLRVTVTADDETVTVTFADTGAGLPESPPAPFSSGKPEGWGLGLATSRKILSAHGGSLTLANRAEGGVTAAFTLPIRNQNPDQPPDEHDFDR